MIDVNWLNLKNIASTTSKGLHFTEYLDSYIIYLSNNSIIYKTVIGKTTPRSTDQADFEDNYKTNANQAVYDYNIATLSNGTNEVAIKNSPPLSVDYGLVVRPVTVEYPTFSIASFDVAVANNKSLLAIQNTGTAVVRIREIWIINDRTTATTGVAGEFQINRITSFTGGISQSIVSYDTNDVLPSGISASSGATVLGEGDTLRKGRWSTDEWGPGTLDQEGLDHGLQQIEPFWRQTPNGKALTIRQNQGIHVKFATNSNNGAFTIRIIFTTE